MKTVEPEIPEIVVKFISREKEDETKKKHEDLFEVLELIIESELIYRARIDLCDKFLNHALCFCRLIESGIIEMEISTPGFLFFNGKRKIRKDMSRDEIFWETLWIRGIFVEMSKTKKLYSRKGTLRREEGDDIDIGIGIYEELEVELEEETDVGYLARIVATFINPYFENTGYDSKIESAENLRKFILLREYVLSVRKFFVPRLFYRNGNGLRPIIINGRTFLVVEKF